MSDDPIWIEKTDAEKMHADQLAEHGGADGTRDNNLLESAPSRPRHLFAYSDPTPNIPTLAASYAYGIAKNHAFIDGNKRTALVVCRTFLFLNGFQLVASQDQKFDKFLALAAGELTEEDFAAWLSENVERVDA